MAFWLYISGRGHSGSTMLDAMLGNAEGIESVGELISGMGRYSSYCSCGETFGNCEYWQEVRTRFTKETGVDWDEVCEVFASQAHLMCFPKTILAGPTSEWVKKQCKLSEGMAEAIGKSGQSQDALVVDSSKEATRALFMMRFVDNSKIIHLIRHPGNILQSNYYRLKKGSGFKFLRHHYSPRHFYGPYLLISALSWLVGNLLLELVRCFDRSRVLRVKYEDLIDSPSTELQRIENFIGISLAEVISNVNNGKAFTVGHNIGGNHMRMAGSFLFDPKKAKRSGLPKRYGFMVNLLCWPLLLVYGYYAKNR